MNNQFYSENFVNYLQFAMSFIKDEESAKDIVQNVFIKYWKLEADFKHESAIKSFFYKSIRNACLNYIRHLKVRENYYQGFSADWETNDYFMEMVIQQETRKIIFDALDKLSEIGREVLLKSLEGFSNDEIAQQLNISINTVKTHKARSYMKLRKRLEHLRMLIILLGI